MGDLRAALQRQLCGRTCLMGLGNPERGDDGVGVRLGAALSRAGCPDVILAGTAPERWIATVCTQRFGAVLLLDAVRMGEPPGTAVLLDAAQLKDRYPQVSTHTLSLGTLARLIEAGGPRVLLLGIEAETLAGATLSPAVEGTLQVIRDVLVEVLTLEPCPAGGRR